MTAKKIGHKGTSYQFCLFKIALLFSVFAFSSFNVQVNYTFLESVRTELIDLRDDQLLSSIKSFPKANSKFSSAESIFDFKSPYSWVLSPLSQSLLVEYKSINKEFFTYKNTSLKLLLKAISSSNEDEAPSLLIA